MADIDNKFILAIIALVSGIYGWILRHLFGKVQFKDVCEAKHKGLNDCIEAEMRRNTERYKSLEKSIDELKELIKNGGFPQGRIRT